MDKTNFIYVELDLHQEQHTAVIMDCFNEKLGEIMFQNKPSEFGKGKLKKHYIKHGISDFGANSSKEYSEMAFEFGTRKSDSIIEVIEGAYVYRYEPLTNIVFVGTLKGGNQVFL